MCRELTQVEYTRLFGDIHRDPIKFAQFLTDYNLAVSARKQIDFIRTNRGRLNVTMIMRESLPGYLQDELDLYEQERGIPFIGSVLLGQSA